MNALVLLAEADSGGQVEQIARTFGVDWPHLLAQIISFCIVCLILYRFAYRPVLKMLERRRQQIAQGLANAEKIKGGAGQDRSPAPGSDGAGECPGDQVHRGSPRCGRPRAGAGNAEGHCGRRTDHDQGARSRRAGTRPHARRTQTRGRPVGGASHRHGHRQDSDARKISGAWPRKPPSRSRRNDEDHQTSETRSQATVPLLSGERIAR